MDAMALHETGVIPIFCENKCRKGSYEHIDQMTYYQNVEERDYCYLSEDDSEVDTADVVVSESEQFQKRYRFREKTVKALCLLLGNEIKPIAHTNNAFIEMQKMCIALRFYATGSHQMSVGDGEGASQASVSRIVKQVTLALAGHVNDLVCFHVDQDVMETVAKGFYGFSGSMYCVYFSDNFVGVS